MKKDDGITRSARKRSVIFDVGGVLLDWDPRHLYRKIFARDVDGMEEFLTTICRPEWNARMDAGLPFSEGVAQLVRQHPAKATLIESYWKRWPEMLLGPIPGMGELVQELLAIETPLYGITNWSAEMFPYARESFPLLDAFEGIVVSGEVGLTKPDPAVFRLLLGRFNLEPTNCILVDDHLPNVQAAEALGLSTVLFRDAADLHKELASAGFALGRQ